MHVAANSKCVSSKLHIISAPVQLTTTTSGTHVSSKGTFHDSPKRWKYQKSNSWSHTVRIYNVRMCAWMLLVRLPLFGETDTHTHIRLTRTFEYTFMHKAEIHTHLSTCYGLSYFALSSFNCLTSSHSLILSNSVPSARRREFLVLEQYSACSTVTHTARSSVQCSKVTTLYLVLGRRSSNERVLL